MPDHIREVEVQGNENATFLDSLCEYEIVFSSDEPLVPSELDVMA